MTLTDRHLLQLHLEAVWDIRLPPLLGHEAILRPNSQCPPWDLYIAELASGRLYIWNGEIAISKRHDLIEQANDALVAPITAPISPHISREIAFSQTATPLMTFQKAQHQARRIQPTERALFETFERDSSAYFSDIRRQPLYGVVQNGRLLSLAHSSRRTRQACELGIDTIPESRRRGYALATTLLWAEAVRQEGLVPIYSALIENTASLKLAHAAGYQEFARGVSIKQA
jgi:hypothetical protein